VITDTANADTTNADTANADTANTDTATTANTTAKKRVKIKILEPSEIQPPSEEIQPQIGLNSTLIALKAHCKQLGIKGISKKNKTELLEIIKNHN
jgi:hypothetical protein